MGLAPQASRDEIEILYGRLPDMEYRSMIQSLNVKQMQFFTHVMHHVKTKDTPLRLFLTGGAGVGKSVVLRALYQSLHRHFCSNEGENPEDCRILVCAYTGLAAYNVKGSTLHSALKIQPNKTLSKYTKLSQDALNTVRMKFRNLSVLLIDEISLVGNNMLKQVNLRLQEITGLKEIDFGGIHVIVFGDLFQLKPVMDGWIFNDLNSDYGSLATNLWKKTLPYVRTL